MEESGQEKDRKWKGIGECWDVECINKSTQPLYL